MLDFRKTDGDTKTMRVAQALARSIFEGELDPKRPLVRRQLVERYNVSISIINEALNRLAQEGIVEMPVRGSARIVQLDPKQIEGELMLREAIECQVARLLAQHASDDALMHLRHDAAALDRWLAMAGPDANMHLDFHLKMARLTGYSALEEALRRLVLRTVLINRWLKNQEIEHPADFHESYVAVLLTRDVEKAEQAARDHLNYSGKVKQDS